MNTRSTHLQNFGATGVSSDLAARVTLTQVSQGRLGESYTDLDLLLIPFCTAVHDCCWVSF
jgi:hypothetical protein